MSWTKDIHDVAIQFMNAQVVFYTVSDAAPNTAIILWQGKARVQHIREPREASSVYGESKTRRFRFQLDPDDNPPFFKSGVYARVLSGGENPDLLKLVYVVDSAVNASWQAVRTVELRAEMEEVPAMVVP